jgi:tRNA-dihydrouridine synthase A
MTIVSKFSVAPMMDWTDRHCRYFHRLINKDIVLYTEMVTTGALLHADPERFLRFHEDEQPVVLQLGGSEPEDLARCAKMAEDYGYEAVNLNCGCPSERVQKGAFGACLMNEPALVADCIKAMRETVTIPVTIKCRIGIDDSDEYTFLEDFVRKNSEAGCQAFIIHARKAWLKGLSPKENREVPPLNYERVFQLKRENPDLDIHLNGGVQTLQQIKLALPHVDGIMIGREAYQNPWFLREIAQKFDITTLSSNRREIVEKMMQYAGQELKNKDVKLHDITRHMLGLFKGLKGGKSWRQHLSQVNQKSGNDPDFILNFLNNFRAAVIE